MVVRPKIINQYSKYDDTYKNTRVIFQSKPTKAIKPIVDQTWQTVKQVWLIINISIYINTRKKHYSNSAGMSMSACIHNIDTRVF